MEDKNAVGELKVKDKEEKMRLLREWTNDTKDFMKNYAGIEVNLLSKHKKIFDTVNELNKWLEGLDDLSNKEMGHLGEKSVKDTLKGEEKRRLALWTGDTGASTHMTHVRKGFI